ncbi:MAG: hypothetical protein AAFU73_13545 [Planctomycetota bacterium]
MATKDERGHRIGPAVRRAVWAALALGCALGGLSVAGGRPLADADVDAQEQAPSELIGGVRWLRDLSAARREAYDKGKPLLIVVRCPP